MTTKLTKQELLDSISLQSLEIVDFNEDNEDNVKHLSAINIELSFTFNSQSFDAVLCAEDTFDFSSAGEHDDEVGDIYTACEAEELLTAHDILQVLLEKFEVQQKFNAYLASPLSFKNCKNTGN